MFGDRTEEVGGAGLSYPQAGLGLFAFVRVADERVTVAWRGSPEFVDLLSLCRQTVLALRADPRSISLVAFDEEGPTELEPYTPSRSAVLQTSVGLGRLSRQGRCVGRPVGRAGLRAEHRHRG